MSFSTLMRLLILLALGGHVFYMYCLGRATAGGIGLSAGTVIVAGLFGLVMLVPLVWAVTVPELPAMLEQWRGRSRYDEGRCQACGQDQQGTAADRPCPECGAAVAPPPPFRVNGPMIRRYVILNIAAWVIGSAAGEVWVNLDERRFLDEARQHVARVGSDSVYTRSRAWPVDANELVYVDGRGAMTPREYDELVHKPPPDPPDANRRALRRGRMP